jgi:hypothetical protein
MSIRSFTAAAILLLAANATARAVEGGGAEAGNRVITIIKPINSGGLFPFRNPGVMTLGTLSILNRIDFAISAITTNGNKAGGALTFAWNWGDGTPNGSGALPNHTYVVPGNYVVTVTTTEAGNDTPTVSTIPISVTDAIKSAKLQTNEIFSSNGSDSITLKGIVRIPSGLNLQGQPATIFVGGADGVTFNFTLNEKGYATLTTNLNAVFDTTALAIVTTQGNCSASLKLNYRTRSKGVAFVDAPFTFSAKKGSFNQALAVEIPNPKATGFTPNRDNVRFTVRVIFPNFPIITNALVPPVNPGGGILFQSGINQLYTANKERGKTR